ncbi:MULTISPECIES: putative ATP-grasp-modified RiPP [unclassified Streptosporangium]|uniref:putative ATP-grasp-modified RiPP n=1 Tax=unclassified Streptosporangium TaxID=2632669 RepID=UPI002E2BD472|nr:MULTISPECIES: putative ATP-grasp-modified RiPP [unclassified Streptosporangium]
MGNLTLQPWGLSRATEVHDDDPPFYASVEVDPVTQLSVFYDEGGEIIDAKNEPTERRYPMITVSKRGDGAQGAPNVADDTDNDRSSD